MFKGAGGRPGGSGGSSTIRQLRVGTPTTVNGKVDCAPAAGTRRSGMVTQTALGFPTGNPSPRILNLGCPRGLPSPSGRPGRMRTSATSGRGRPPIATALAASSVATVVRPRLCDPRITRISLCFIIGADLLGFMTRYSLDSGLRSRPSEETMGTGSAVSTVRFSCWLWTEKDVRVRRTLVHGATRATAAPVQRCLFHLLAG